MTDKEMAKEYVDTLLDKDDSELDKLLDENLGDLELNIKQAGTLLGIIKGVGICSFLAGLETGKPKWHKVADGDLPKDEKDVLVYSGEEWRMCVGRYSPKYKAWETGCDTIAWLEIPELPKQEENGNECHDCVAFDAMPRAPRCRICDNGSRFKAREEAK